MYMYGTESVMDSFSDTWAKAKDNTGHIAATIFAATMHACVSAFIVAVFMVMVGSVVVVAAITYEKFSSRIT